MWGVLFWLVALGGGWRDFSRGWKVNEGPDERGEVFGITGAYGGGRCGSGQLQIRERSYSLRAIGNLFIEPKHR